MKITFANGEELSPILITGENRWVQGTQRDTLSFIFPADAGLDELDGLFTPENCESIRVEDGEGSYIHTGYTVRAELKRAPVTVGPETVEDRVTVSMARRTYLEERLASLTETVDALVLESLTRGE